MDNDQIIVIDKVEDDSYDNKDFKKITDKAGNKFNIKQGQGGKLKEKWHLLEEGIAIKLKVGTYNNKPFVKDFEVVKDEFVKQAAERAQLGVRVERNDSIEAQVAFKGIVELIVAGKLNNPVVEQAAVDWAMARINLPSVIVTKIEEAKSETHTTDKGSEETQGEPTDRQDGGETIKTAGELFNWIMKQDPNIKAPRVWVNAEFRLDDKEVLTDKRIKELYKEIKKKKEW